MGIHAILLAVLLLASPSLWSANRGGRGPTGATGAQGATSLLPLTATGLTTTGTEADGGTVVCNPAGAGTAGDGCLTHVGPLFALDAGFRATGAIVSGSTVTGSNLSGANTGDVTISAGNGLTIAGQALTETCAGAGQPGPLCGSSANGSGRLTVDAGVSVGGDIVVAGSITSGSTLTRGSITLSSGTGTSTVNASAICGCFDTGTTPLPLRSSLSGTTLTCSEATGTSTHVVNYICL